MTVLGVATWTICCNCLRGDCRFCRGCDCDTFWHSLPTTVGAP